MNRGRWPVLAAGLCACTGLAPSCGGPTPGAPGAAAWVGGTHPALTVALAPVGGPGIRDLAATVSVPGARLTWLRDGEPVDRGGEATIPAREVWPGERWTVWATLPDGSAAAASYEVPEPPGGNVLVLLLDDVGADQIRAYGINGAAPPTPVIDGLAAEGVRFTRAYASPVCSPSRGMLLTGRLPRRTGVGWIIDTGSRAYALPLATTLAPEALAGAHGEAWSAAALGKWHLAGPLSAGFLTHPNDAGFAHHAGSLGNPPYSPGRGYWDWDKSIDGALSVSTTYMTTDTVDDALAEARALPEPWFLYVAFNAAHTPLSAPPPALVGTPVTDDDDPGVLYDATLEALDAEIGRLLAGIDPAVRARTTVITVGDNGTSELGVDPPVDPEHAKHTVYEPGIHVPLVVTGPHVAVPGATCDALVSIADVFPTLMAIAGVPLGGADDARDAWGGAEPGAGPPFLDVDPEDGGPIALDGRSLLPYLADPGAPGPELLYIEAFSPNGAGPTHPLDRRILRNDRFKLMRLGTEPDRLFDVTDPLAVDEGPDLLADAAPLSDDAEAALAELGAALDRIEAELVFEGR